VSLGINTIELERQLNLFRTPPYPVLRLLKIEKFSGTVWDPCAGLGDLAAPLRLCLPNPVIETDIFDWARMEHTPENDIQEIDRIEDNIVTNPTYRGIASIVVAMQARVRRKLALLLPLSFAQGFRSYRTLFDGDVRCKAIYTFRREIRFRGLNLKPFSGCRTAWYVWERGYKGDVIVVKEIG